MPETDSDEPIIERTNLAQLNRTASIRDIPEPDASDITDPFADDTPLVCGIENPEHCESCQ